MDKDGNPRPNIERPQNELPPFPRLPITLEHPIKTSRHFYKTLVQKFGDKDLLNSKIWGTVPKYLTEVQTRRESVEDNDDEEIEDKGDESEEEESEEESDNPPGISISI